ncbi:MAG: hypothetical protein U0575_10135 [Phycisphaerales bacterium]
MGPGSNGKRRSAAAKKGASPTAKRFASCRTKALGAIVVRTGAGVGRRSQPATMMPPETIAIQSHGSRRRTPRRGRASVDRRASTPAMPSSGPFDAAPDGAARSCMCAPALSGHRLHASASAEARAAAAAIQPACTARRGTRPTSSTS